MSWNQHTKANNKNVCSVPLEDAKMDTDVEDVLPMASESASVAMGIAQLTMAPWWNKRKKHQI